LAQEPANNPLAEVDPATTAIPSVNVDRATTAEETAALLATEPSAIERWSVTQETIAPVLTGSDEVTSNEATGAGASWERAAGPAGAPSSEQPKQIAQEMLVVINPPTTGGVVHFLLDGEIVSLAPGELARVLAKESRLVQFHRGDDFGDEELRLVTGVYAFAVSERGWTLAEAETAFAARLLEVCRPVAPKRADQDESDAEDDA
jgi:hypothetical protein